MKKIVVGIALASTAFAAFVCMQACSSSSHATTTTDADAQSEVDADADVDSGVSYIQPGETPQNHLPFGSTCRTTRPPVMPDIDDAGSGYGTVWVPLCVRQMPRCCTSDSDCVDGGPGKTNGRCANTYIDGDKCTWDDCATASDCSSNQACVCASDDPNDTNRCVSGNCRTDDDCGNGGFCSPSLGNPCDGVAAVLRGTSAVVGAYCHTPDDKCLNDSDCASLPKLYGEPQRCRFNPEQNRWACSATPCAG